MGLSRNLLHHLFHTPDTAHDLIHRAASLRNERCTGPHLPHTVSNQLANLFRSIGTAARKRTDFGRDDRKTLALFAGARGFDRGIQRK